MLDRADDLRSPGSRHSTSRSPEPYRSGQPGSPMGGRAPHEDVGVDRSRGAVATLIAMADADEVVRLRLLRAIRDTGAA